MDKGIVVEELGGLELVEIEVEDPHEHEVLVRVEASGVCHSDLHVLETGFSTRRRSCSGTKARASSRRSGPASRPSAWATGW